MVNNKLSFDPAVNLDLYFRKGRNSERILRFKNEDDTPFDVSANEFEFIAAFAVTVTVDQDEILLSIADTVTPTRASYFWELKNTTTGQTWFTGTAHFTDGLSAEQDNTDEIVMKLDGDVVEVTLASPVVVSTGSFKGEFTPSGPDDFPSGAVVGDEYVTTIENDFYGEKWPEQTILKYLGNDVWRLY